jgi:cellulose synthase/poly-beta-1,6-N-acetylglucosamine synthase-like glycosyltransferase
MPEPIAASSPRPNEAKPEQASPLVSVIIPAFNAAGYIGGALESVFAQTFTDYEVILANDGSQDTERLELAIRPYISRITYLTQENRGPSTARNLGIRHARGEWLAFLDSDDAWLPHYLAEQLKFLHSDPSLDMVYCDATLEGDTDAAGKTFMQLCPSAGPVTFDSVLVERTQVLTSGTVIRKRSVTAAGLFDEEIRCSEDHDLWLRVIHTGGKVAYQRQALLRRTVRPESQGSIPGGLFAGEIQSLKKLDLALDLNPGTRALLAQRLRKIQAELAFIEGKAFLLAGEPDKAYVSLRLAHDFAPTSKLRAVLLGLRIAPRLTLLGARFWRRRAPRLPEA